MTTEELLQRVASVAQDRRRFWPEHDLTAAFNADNRLYA